MPNVNLTAGAGAGLPLDLAAQLQKQAMLQQLAESLLGQSMQQEPATIRTAAGNPYGRDVPNLAPLGKIAQSYLGSKMLGQSQDAQIGLANAAQQRALDERSQILSALTGTNSVMGDQVGKPGSAQAALGVGAAFPQNQALQNSLLEAMVKAEESRAVKGSDIAPLTRVNQPSSVARAVKPGGLFNFNQIDPKELEPLAHILQTPSGGAGTILPLPGAQVQPSSGPVPTVPAAPNPTLSAATGAPTVTESGTGNPKVVEGPTQKVNAEYANARFEEAGKSKDEVASFKESIPQYISLAKLAQAAYKQGTFGPNADIFNAIRKWGAAIGINPDPEGKITNFETYIKDAVPLATAKAKVGVGARVAVVEFQSFLNSLGATGSTDARAVMNIIQGRLLSGANQAQLYQNHILPSLSELPAYKENARALQLPFNFEKEVLKPLAQANIPFHWSTPDTGAGGAMGGETGLLQNEQIGVPGAPASNYLPGKGPIKFGDLK